MQLVNDGRPLGAQWWCGGLLAGLVAAFVPACVAPPQVMPAQSNGGAGGGGSSSNTGGAGSDDGSGGSRSTGGAGGGFSVSDADQAPPDLANADASCGFQKYELENRPAELLLVLDRSGSMDDRPRGGANTKWVEATGALDEVLGQTDEAILWGLKLFPSGTQTCTSIDGIDVPLGLGNAPTIISTYKTAGPEGDGTPTSETIKRAVAYLKANPSTNARYLLLATDGEPTCKDGIDGDLRDDLAAVAAIKEAAAAGLHTFVVGIATDSATGQVLDDMAVAGMEPRASAPHYYPAANKQDLINAFGVITGKVSDCTFPLKSTPPSPSDVAVNIGPTRISRDSTHANGWDYTAGNNAIQVHGAACDRVKAGAAGDDVSIIFGCPNVVIP